MYYMRFVLAFLFLSGLVFTSCRSSKKLQSAITKKDTIITLLVNPAESDSVRLVHTTFDKIKNNRIDYTAFTSKVKVNYRDTKQRNYDFNAFVRIQKDSIIWISINAALGIEAFRVTVTPDSVKVLDKLDKYVQYRSVEYLREVVQLPLDYYTLQDLIVGNPVYLDSTNVVMYKERENSISLSTLGDFFKQLLTMRKEDYAILHSKLDDVDAVRNRTADFTYDDFVNVENRLFATKRKITVTEKNRIDIDLEYKQVEFDKAQTYPFNIPKNYKLK